MQHRTLVVLPLFGLLLGGATPETASAQDAAVPVATHLQIASEPSDAVVFVNRNPVGNTPLTLRNLPTGKHLITLQKRGFLDAHATIDLAPDMRRALDLRLDPVTGLLLIHSTPTGAEVTANGLSMGVTPLLIATLPLGTHRLRVSSPGFQSREQEVQIVDRTPRKIEVSLVSDSGSLEIESDPEGAEVVLNGVNRGNTPRLIERIPEGDVTLEVRAEGYIAGRQTLRLAAGELQRVRIALKPMPASLRVTSLPPRGRVYLDNILQGETPLEIGDLPPGMRRVRVELEGFDPEARNVNLERGATRAEEFRLSANTGRMELTTDPAGAQIFLGGRNRGKTTAGPDEATRLSAPLSIEDIPAGEHELRVIREGYFDKIQQVSIERGRTLTENIVLARRFIPNYEVITARGVHRGVLDSLTSDALRLETAPGVIKTFLLRDIRARRPIRDNDPLPER